MATVLDQGYLESISPEERELADRFLELYYNSRENALTWNNTTWFGARTLRCPLDLWLYQEIVYETRPDLIIETGTAEGGGAAYLASLCDLIGKGEVISIDVEKLEGRPQHPRITYITGSSVANDVVEQVDERAANARSTLVILDSDHSMAHVYAELLAYSRLVRPATDSGNINHNLNRLSWSVFVCLGRWQSVFNLS